MGKRLCQATGARCLTDCPCAAHWKVHADRWRRIAFRFADYIIDNGGRTFVDAVLEDAGAEQQASHTEEKR